MKKLLFLAGLVIAMNSSAQNATIPEFKNKVMFVQTDKSLAELDKTDMNSDLHTNMKGHSEVNLVANGKVSSVTNTGAATDNYIVKIESGIDPSNVVELFIFDVGKKNRKILVAEMSMGKDKTVQLTKVKLSFTKVTDGVYQISTATKLESGEYCFLVNRPNISIMGAMNSQSIIGYCFSVK
jgi:hypothetical protein